MTILEIEIRKFADKMELFFSRKEKYPGFGFSWDTEKVDDAEKEIERFKRLLENGV